MEQQTEFTVLGKNIEQLSKSSALENNKRIQVFIRKSLA